MKRIFLFVCTGNICRSPLACGYFNALAEKLKLQDVVGISAGTHAEPGIFATAEACQIAEAHGFNITHHRSQYLTVEMIEQAENIFVMDRVHAHTISLLSPAAQHKTLLLGFKDKRADRRVEVADPYMQSYRTYLDSFKLIAHGVEKLIDDLGQNS